MRTTTKLWAAAALTVPIAALVAQRWAGHEQHAATSPEPSASAAIEKGAVPPVAKVIAAPPSGPVTASKATPSKSTEYAELVKAASPDAKFRAYMVAQACVWAIEAKRVATLTAPGERSEQTRARLDSGELDKQQVQACGDLTEQQLASRSTYLTQAAEAGVPMAALRLSAEGPFGDPTALYTRPNDPAVLEWRNHMVDLLKLAASKGDISAMNSLSNMYASGSGIVAGRDPVKALEYATAMWDAQQKQTGKPSAFADQRTKELSEGLTVEQADAAKKAGHALAMGGEK